MIPEWKRKRYHIINLYRSYKKVFKPSCLKRNKGNVCAVFWRKSENLEETYTGKRRTNKGRFKPRTWQYKPLVPPLIMIIVIVNSDLLQVTGRIRCIPNVNWLPWLFTSPLPLLSSSSLPLLFAPSTNRHSHTPFTDLCFFLTLGVTTLRLWKNECILMLIVSPGTLTQTSDAQGFFYWRQPAERLIEEKR